VLKTDIVVIVVLTFNTLMESPTTERGFCRVKI